jgi:hypothetical protein
MKSFRNFGLLLLISSLQTMAQAQQINDESYRSIVAALQAQQQVQPSVFPMGTLEGEQQGVAEGLALTYFGFGERRFSDRTDFHMSLDVTYGPLETGEVETVYEKTRRVRAPASYLKKIYAIQEGLLVSAGPNATGNKLILKHTLEQPYVDHQGHEYHEYYTSYRHVDTRTLVYLSLGARKLLNDEKATYKDLVGKHVFPAGHTIAFVGFDPNSSGYPRSHLDFSLHVFGDASKGSNIRKYSINPLLLFPAFEYTDPASHQLTNDNIPAYHFVIDKDSQVIPRKRKSGKFQIRIPAGGLSEDGVFKATRYFALNAVEFKVINDGQALATHLLNRDQRRGYDPSSYDKLDNPDESKPYFQAPLGEQGDIYQMDVVIPRRWFKNMDYDWSKAGIVKITVSSIWSENLAGHELAFEMPLEAD